MSALLPHAAGARAVKGLDGLPLTKADLPSPGTRRWSFTRKAKIVAAVNGGLISAEDARLRYGISREELREWARAHEAFGFQGLKTTKLQKLYRGGA